MSMDSKFVEELLDAVFDVGTPTKENPWMIIVRGVGFCVNDGRGIRVKDKAGRLRPATKKQLERIAAALPPK